MQKIITLISLYKYNIDYNISNYTKRNNDDTNEQTKK